MPNEKLIAFLLRMSTYLSTCKVGPKAIRYVSWCLNEMAGRLLEDAAEKIEKPVGIANAGVPASCGTDDQTASELEAIERMISSGFFRGFKIGEARQFPERVRELNPCCDCGVILWTVPMDGMSEEKPKHPLCASCVRARFPGILLQGRDL